MLERAPGDASSEEPVPLGTVHRSGPQSAHPCAHSHSDLQGRGTQIQANDKTRQVNRWWAPRGYSGVLGPDSGVRRRKGQWAGGVVTAPRRRAPAVMGADHAALGVLGSAADPGIPQDRGAEVQRAWRRPRRGLAAAGDFRTIRVVPGPIVAEIGDADGGQPCRDWWRDPWHEEEQHDDRGDHRPTISISPAIGQYPEGERSLIDYGAAPDRRREGSCEACASSSGSRPSERSS